MTIFTLLRAFSGTEPGRPCRRCTEPIPADDAFGLREAVWRPCRAEPG